MHRARYRFRSVWDLDAPASDVYAVLRDLPSYPLWWPEVRSVRGLTAQRAELLCRSVLPYDLRFTAQRRVDDPGGRILEARLTGDLDGWSRWRVRPAAGGGCRALFEEEVTTTAPLLNALAPVARPLFRMNHARMMRSGLQGLRCFLAGVRYQRGRAGDVGRPGPPGSGTGPS